MNKITFEHYPASRLPEDLREGLEKNATVRIVIEEETTDRQTEEDELFPGFKDFPKVDLKPMTVEDLSESIKRIRAENRTSVSMEEAVSRIRTLRDEWDD